MSACSCYNSLEHHTWGGLMKYLVLATAFALAAGAADAQNIPIAVGGPIQPGTIVPASVERADDRQPDRRGAACSD